MNWPRIPLRRLFRVVNGGTPTSDPENWNGSIPWATPVDLGSVSGKLNSTRRTITEKGARTGSTVVPAGSILISTRAPIGYTAITGVPLAFNQGCRALVPTGEVDARFFCYQLESMKNALQSQGLGSTFLELSSEALAALPIVNPPLDVQGNIANFLDSETRGIDRLSGLISRQLDLLEERRQWTLDEVWRRAGRAQWKKLGYATLLVTSGPRGWGGYLDDDGEIFFRSANLNRRSLVPDLSDVAYVRLPAEARVEAVRSRISSGDVLVGITGANSGWVALADASVSGGYVSQHVSLVRPDSRILDGRWLGYMIASSVVQSELMGSQYGGTKTQLSLPDIRNIRIPDIPLEEQRRLVREVERTEELINRQKSLRKKQLSLLAERRQALITAAVTGQIDVTTARGADLS
ncbi:restriction endonuclease subunit S [Thermobifida cellulosilytica]|uniref:restriction endonuclease subunit S n=1 Tax=Thermobifida cellulosilytica TaxID=144786 RepID=UPI000A01B9DD|nr:restriction endonuclease subunit S [Thermobifida cellulosilytica]